MTNHPTDRRSILRPLRPLLLLLLLGLLSLTATGCATDKQVISQANQFHTSLEPAVIKDAQLSKYIQTVGDRIIAAAEALDKQGFGPASHKKESAAWMFAKGGMQFHFVNSKTINAFTTGGNHMYVYTELFQKCDTEDELAAVMAHEFAHVYARHVQKGMNRQIVTMVGAAGVGAAGYAAGGKEHGQQYASAGAGLAAMAGQYFGMSYTREDEDEADRLGFQFYSHAGWDPNRFADFFRKMISMGMDTQSAAASDHPTLKSRVEKTDQRVKNLPPEASRWRQQPVASPSELRQYQQRTASLATTMPNDQQLQQSKELLAALPRSCLTPRDQALPDQQDAQVDLIKKIQAARDAQQGQAQKTQRRRR
jgi:predicted Zn-dependent protease